MQILSTMLRVLPLLYASQTLYNGIIVHLKHRNQEIDCYEPVHVHVDSSYEQTEESLQHSTHNQIASLRWHREQAERQLHRIYHNTIQDHQVVRDGDDHGGEL